MAFRTWTTPFGLLIISDVPEPSPIPVREKPQELGVIAYRPDCPTCGKPAEDYLVNSDYYNIICSDCGIDKSKYAMVGTMSEMNPDGSGYPRFQPRNFHDDCEIKQKRSDWIKCYGITPEQWIRNGKPQLTPL